MMRYIEYGPEPGAESLRLAEAAPPQAGAGEVLIEVHFAGVNGPDIAQRQGRYLPPPGASPVLGLEVSGRIAAIGTGVSGWRQGDAVAALVPGGGYAEYCLAPAGQVLPVPEGLSLAEAAGVPEVWFTVWANLVQMAHLKAGESVLIHGGSGGIGLAAIQLARLVGAVPYVTVGNADKAAFCVNCGAEAAIDYRTEDFVARIKEITGKQGVDVVLDMVGAPYVQKNLSLLRRDGRLVMIAFMQGSKAEIDLLPVMVKRLTLTGSTMRPRSVEEKTVIRDALQREVWPAFVAGRLKVQVFEVFPAERASEAHRLMESSRHIGKILLQMR
jgi:NADPH2:quinone reductase